MDVNRNKRVRYAGISKHAQELGVSRIHLWYVLEGRRESRRLKERYHALIRHQHQEKHHA
jgi:hypothetical protein